ncbi:MAG: hypothetical protein SF187_02235 [Deltaproteobacteria bacterium]|nr:hypothetical protein [Deltaproteobacteria bacterium]
MLPDPPPKISTRLAIVLLLAPFACMADPKIMTAADGDARSFASADAHEADAPNGLAPCGGPRPVERRWIGASSPWNDGTAWYPPHPPRSDESVAISVAAPGAPRLVAFTSVASLCAPASHPISSDGHTLHIFEYLDAVVLGPGMVLVDGLRTQIRGMVPGLTVQGVVRLDGDVGVDGDVAIEGRNLLEVGAHRMFVSGGLRSNGTARLLMKDAGGVVNVRGSVSLAGGAVRGVLTNGTLTVGGDFSVERGAYRPSEGHSLVLDGREPQRVVLSCEDAACLAPPSDEAAFLNHVRVSAPARVTLTGGPAFVAKDLIVESGAQLLIDVPAFVAGDLHLAGTLMIAEGARIQIDGTLRAATTALRGGAGTIITARCEPASSAPAAVCP